MSLKGIKPPTSRPLVYQHIVLATRLRPCLSHSVTSRLCPLKFNISTSSTQSAGCSGAISAHYRKKHFDGIYLYVYIRNACLTITTYHVVVKRSCRWKLNTNWSTYMLLLIVVIRRCLKHLCAFYHIRDLIVWYCVNKTSFALFAIIIINIIITQLFKNKFLNCIIITKSCLFLNCLIISLYICCFCWFKMILSSILLSIRIYITLFTLFGWPYWILSCI